MRSNYSFFQGNNSNEVEPNAQIPDISSGQFFKEMSIVFGTFLLFIITISLVAYFVIRQQSKRRTASSSEKKSLNRSQHLTNYQAIAIDDKSEEVLLGNSSAGNELIQMTPVREFKRGN